MVCNRLAKLFETMVVEDDVDVDQIRLDQRLFWLLSLSTMYHPSRICVMFPTPASFS